MREIKFRGRRIDNGAWVYGHYFVSPLTDENSGTNMDKGWFFLSDCIKRHCVESNGVSFVVDPDSVGQFTGLHDKNGKEIYEGDIVSCDSVFIVKWDEKHAMYKCYFVGLDEHYCNLSDDYIRDYFSVIGNIHENPDLLSRSE